MSCDIDEGIHQDVENLDGEITCRNCGMVIERILISTHAGNGLMRELRNLNLVPRLVNTRKFNKRSIVIKEDQKVDEKAKVKDGQSISTPD